MTTLHVAIIREKKGGKNNVKKKDAALEQLYNVGRALGVNAMHDMGSSTNQTSKLSTENPNIIVRNSETTRCCIRLGSSFTHAAAIRM